MQPGSSRDGPLTRSNSLRKAPAMPGFGSKRTDAKKDTLHSHLLPHVEFELPSPAVASHAPAMHHAGLGHVAFEADRHDFAGLTGLAADLHRREFFELIAIILDQSADPIVLARCAGEETELGGLSDYKSELAPWNALLRAFLHAERHHGERLERCGESRDRRHST